MSMNKRLSILYYTLNDLSTVVYYRHYLFALFIGFQEGYVFGNILKVIKYFQKFRKFLFYLV